jgi:hypothetical protein
VGGQVFFGKSVIPESSAFSIHGTPEMIVMRTDRDRRVLTDTYELTKTDVVDRKISRVFE